MHVSGELSVLSEDIQNEQNSLCRLFTAADMIISYNMYLFTLWVSPAGSKVQKRVCLWHASGWRERSRRGEAREREHWKQGWRQLINSSISFWKIQGNMKQQCGECFVHACEYIQCVHVLSLCNQSLSHCRRTGCKCPWTRVHLILSPHTL